MKHGLHRACCMIVLVLLCATPARSADDRGQIERREVERLVEQLDADRAAERDEAERRLVELGPAVLPLLPALDDSDLSQEQRLRLQRIIRKLRLGQAKQQLAGSRVTVKGRYRLSQLLALLHEQTGNRIVDRRAELGQPVDDPELTVAWHEQLFWDALLELCRKVNLRPEFYDAREAVGLIAGPPLKGPHTVQGGLLLAAERLTLTMDYHIGRPVGSLDLLLAWEPKIRVVRVVLNLDELTLVDDTGRPLIVNGAAGGTVLVRPETGQFAVSVTLPIAPPRLGASEIEHVEAIIRLLVSASTRVVRIGPLRSGLTAKQQTAELRLDVLRVTDEAGVWRIQTRVEYIGEQELTAEALTESYEDWFLQTTAYLQNRRTGERFELNGGYNLLATGERSFAIEYLFVDAPGKLADYDLVLEVPSEPVWVPVTVRFKSLPLPLVAN